MHDGIALLKYYKISVHTDTEQAYVVQQQLLWLKAMCVGKSWNWVV